MFVQIVGKYCASCEAKREQKRAQAIQSIKDSSGAIVGAVGTVGSLAVKHKDKIAAAGKVAMKIIKK